MAIHRSERKEWAREHFRGLENCIMPSFTADLRELDEEGIRLDVRQSVRHGVFSSLLTLEAGLTVDEQKRMLTIACDEAGDEIGIALSLSGETIEQNAELLAHAESVGATHALLSYPLAFRPRTQDEVYEFVAGVAESTNLGIYLFNSDKFGFHHLHPSGVPFDAYERAADIDNVVALKIGGMDAGMVLECFERFNDRILVSTPNPSMLPILAQEFGLQWSGAWTIEALQSPEKPYAVEFFNLLLEGEYEAAMQAYWAMAPAVGSMMRVMMPIVPTGIYHWSLLKFQQWISGGNGGLTRQPSMRMIEQNMMMIRGGLQAIGIECPDPNEDFFVGRAEIARRDNES